ALAEVAIAYQIGDPQVFQRDDIILAHQRQRRLVRKVPTLPLHLLMVFGDQYARLLTGLASLLAPGEPFLRFGEPFLAPAVVTGIVHRLPVSREEKDLHAYINAGLSTSQRHRRVGTSTQEKHTYQPSASRERVTVLGVPWRGRLQRTASYPIL